MQKDDLTPEARRLEELLARGISREKAARILAAELVDGEPEVFDDWVDDGGPGQPVEPAADQPPAAEQQRH